MQPNQMPSQGECKKELTRKVVCGGEGKRRSGVAWLERKDSDRLYAQAAVGEQRIVQNLEPGSPTQNERKSLTGAVWRKGGSVWVRG